MEPLTFWIWEFGRYEVIKPSDIAKKIRAVFGHSGALVSLVMDGVEYDGMWESTTYTQRYRDVGYVDNVQKTWIGVAQDFSEGYPEATKDVVLQGIHYRVAGYQLDPVSGVIRVDLLPPNAGDMV